MKKYIYIVMLALICTACSSEKPSESVVDKSVYDFSVGGEVSDASIEIQGVVFNTGSTSEMSGTFSEK